MRKPGNQGGPPRELTNLDMLIERVSSCPYRSETVESRHTKRGREISV